MLLLLFIVVYASYDFSIIARRNEVTSLSRFSSQTLKKSLVKNLDITGDPMFDCTHYKNDTYFTTIIINGSVTNDLYNIDNNGIIKGFKKYDSIEYPVIDNNGDLYAISIIDRRFSIINIGYTNHIKYKTKDWLDMMFYDKISKSYILVVNLIHGWDHITIMKDWNIIPINSAYRIWTIIPHNNTLYVFAYNSEVYGNQLLEINLITNGWKVLIIYNQTDGVLMGVLVNNKIHSLMNIISSQKQFLAITDLNTLKVYYSSSPI